MSGKARFSGKSIEGKWYLPESARNKIEVLFSNMAHDIFSEHLFVMIEMEVRWARKQIDYFSKEGSREDIEAELCSLYNRTKSLRDNFRTLSRDVDRLFKVDEEPKEYADYFDKVCEDIKNVISRSKQQPKKIRKDVFRRKIAVEMAVRLLRVVKGEGMKVAATVHPKDYWVSDAVELLRYAGKPIGLDYKQVTWRDIIIDAQRKAKDLSPNH